MLRTLVNCGWMTSELKQNICISTSTDDGINMNFQCHGRQNVNLNSDLPTTRDRPAHYRKNFRAKLQHAVLNVKFCQIIHLFNIDYNNNVWLKLHSNMLSLLLSSTLITRMPETSSLPMEVTQYWEKERRAITCDYARRQSTPYSQRCKQCSLPYLRARMQDRLQSVSSMQLTLRKHHQ